MKGVLRLADPVLITTRSSKARVSFQAELAKAISRCQRTPRRPCWAKSKNCLNLVCNAESSIYPNRLETRSRKGVLHLADPAVITTRLSKTRAELAKSLAISRRPCRAKSKHCLNLLCNARSSIYPNRFETRSTKGASCISSRTRRGAGDIALSKDTASSVLGQV